MSTSPHEELELLLDKMGLPLLLASLADIANEKAEHVATNWQDQNLAKRWRKAGTALGTFSRRMASIF